MKISLNWIKEFVNLDGIEVDELIKRFGLSTAEVEGVEYKGRDIENVVVAKILSVENHANSNHLHILKVDDGSGEPVQVVCGAPNVRVGLKTFFARVGGNVCGVKIKPARLAGVESFGMCCGGNELGIEADDSGIVELDDSLPVGTNIKDILPVEDAIIEVDNKSLTNRPDLWGHYGIAREFACIFKRELKPLELVDLEEFKNLNKINIKVETKNCFRYCGLTVDNVISKRSPAILKLRLNYCGMRDINLLADLTNYLMLELGQPMHAFDNSIVKGINVIEATNNLKMETLEHETHSIEPGTLVICDEMREPVAIAGIKGGLKSGITDNTTSLLLESACFDCATIRKASRKIGHITDASQRYEKSLDPEMCSTAIARLVHILKKAEPNARVTSSLTDVYNYRYPEHTIDIDTDFLFRRGGVKLTADEVADTLSRLGFGVQVVDRVNGKLKVKVPSFRNTKDVSIKEDLVEEVFRMYGYDNIKSQPMSMPLKPCEQLPVHVAEYKIKHALASVFGLSEVHTYLWNYEQFNKSVGINEQSVIKLMDSTHSGQSGIRSVLLPSLIKVADENKNKFSNVNIFEIGRIVDSCDEHNLANEKKKLAIVLSSETKTEKELYFELKRIVEYIAKNIVKATIEYSGQNEKGICHPVNSCVMKSGEVCVGVMGVLHPDIARKVDKRKKFAVLELDVQKFVDLPKVKFDIVPTSKYQSVSLDFNFVADKNLPYGEIEKILTNFRANYILEHSLKDVYTNDDVLKDRISYTINFVITPKDKTLEASDIEKFSSRLVKTMQMSGITLRA